MDIFAEFRTTIIAALDALVASGTLPEGLETRGVTAEPPRDASHGDIASNAAMAVAKQAKANPREIATALAMRLGDDPRVDQAEVAGPGFLNLRLSESFWYERLAEAVAEGERYGRSDAGDGKRVNVEYVSANPTGPLHVGHTRGAVFGDALASLLEFAGHDVTREYYINDGGSQVDTLARSAFQRYREALGHAPEMAEGLYPGDYLIPVGEAMKAKWGDTLLDKPEEEWLLDVRDFATDAMMDLIREDLASLGVVMDEFYSEKSLYGKGVIGVLEPPKGKKPEDWEPREQTLFKSSEFGDDVDRPIKKSDGSWTYFAPDIAYHFDKLQRADELIDVFGADHGGYVKRMKAACKALSDGEDRLDIKLTQLVKLYKDGAEFKMSKRAGTFVTLRDVIDEVGPDVTRFTMLTRKNDGPLDFDFAKALEQSKDNPVFYVQYAHARVCSAMRKAANEEGMTDIDDASLAAADLTKLTHEAEFGLIRKIAEWPRQARGAAENHEPHRVAFYLYDLASEFHSLYNLGQKNAELRFIKENDPHTTKARLALIRATAITISNGLRILGVTPVQEMR
ncbi:UNVERIFIED_CONTAM: hypothetical protein GTU68_045351 [Idotea baltica]|nr:hypothetical protein [Idotea baltica]